MWVGSPETYIIRQDTLSRLGDGDPLRGRRRARLLIADMLQHRVIDGPTTMPEQARIAGPDDEEALVDLLELDVKENAAMIAPASRERLLQLVQTCTQQRGGFCPVVDDAKGRPIGLAILLPMQWWWSTGWFLSETVMFVHPGSRHKRAGAVLLRAEKAIADAMSEKLGERILLLAGVTATQRGDAKVRMYRRHLNPVGAFFCYPSIEV